MAYVPGFQHDIFISYAHVDNAVMPGIEDGWVTTLVACLKPKLAQLLGRSENYSLWMDSDLSKHVKITPQILDALSQTAILIVILSPGYVSSEWCNREKNTFLDLVKKSDSRIFLVERYCIEPDERPSEFDDFAGFRFWHRDKHGKPPRIFGEFSPSHDPEYYPLVNELVYELVDELKKLKKSKQGPGPGGPDQDKPAIFLAQVTDDLEQERNNVRNYLNQTGIKVLPNTWYSQEPKKFKTSVERDLAECRVFVQLLSNLAGKKPPDLPQGYVKLQLEIAQTTQKPILQWRSPSLDVTTISDEIHKKMVDGETVRAEGIEDFKRAIKKSVSKKEKPRDRRPVNAFVFVNMDTSDRPLAEIVCNYLEKHNIGYSLPLEEGDPSDIREVFENNLLDCNAIIIIYGCSTAVWVHRQLLACRKILAQRGKPLQAFAVFEGPPEEKCSIPLKFPNLEIFNFRKGWDENILHTKLGTYIELIQRGT